MPLTADELTAVLEASLRRALTASQNLVAIRERKYPDLAEIAINLDKAKVRMDVLRPPLPKGKGEPAISADRFILNARPLFVGEASLNLTINASDVSLHQTPNQKGDIFLLLHSATDGEIAIAISHQDLEMLVATVAKTEAAKQGVVIEDVRLRLTKRGPRSLGMEARLRARKLFMRATLQVGGQVALEEQLVARLSNLTCTGEGAIATLACTVLNPCLQKLDGRDFSFTALPLGEVQLHDINFETTDGIKVTAKFGANAARRRA